MTPQLSIIAAPNKFGVGKDSSWQWYHEAHLKDISYELIDITKPTPPTGERILLMGQKVLNVYQPTRSVFNARGELLPLFHRPTVATLDLDEAWQFKADKKDKVADPFGKDRAATNRSNFLFWIGADTAKLLRYQGEKPEPLVAQINPPIETAISILNAAQDGVLFFDIETDIESDTLDCIGFAHNNSPIYVVPIYRHTNLLAHPRSQILRFLAAFAGALRRCLAVVHNAMFDLLWLPAKLRIPPARRIFDTMLAHKRILPEIEKSLGHCGSYWTWQNFHKDEGAANKSRINEFRLWEYNAKDVQIMRLIYRAQLSWLIQHSEYAASVEQANASIYPYILATLKGISVDVKKLSAAKISSDKRIAKIETVIRLLIGDPKFNCNSVPQLRSFFHKKLAYKAVDYTPTGQEKLGEKELYQLILKYNNPVLPAILHYREIVKERSEMNFINWIFPWQEL